MHCGAGWRKAATESHPKPGTFTCDFGSMVQRRSKHLAIDGICRAAMISAPPSAPIGNGQPAILHYASRQICRFAEAFMSCLSLR